MYTYNYMQIQELRNLDTQNDFGVNFFMPSLSAKSMSRCWLYATILEAIFRIFGHRGKTTELKLLDSRLQEQDISIPMSEKMYLKIISFHQSCFLKIS